MKYRRLCAGLLGLLLLAGCGPAAETNTTPPTETPVSTPAATPAETEPSAAPTEAPAETDAPETQAPSGAQGDEVWTYCDHFCGDGPLQAWDGYGILLPYVGAVAQVDQFYMNPYTPVYGLCTSQGQLVTEPIYDEVHMENGFLVLTERDEDGTAQTTLAAQDGSWVIGPADGYMAKSFPDLMVLQDGDGGLSCWNSKGEQAATFPAALFTPILGDIFDSYDWYANPTLQGVQDHILYAYSYVRGEEWLDTPLWLYLDLDSGAVLETPPAGYPETLARQEQESVDMDNGLPAYPCTDPCIGALYYTVYVDLGVQVYDSDFNLLSGDSSCPTFLPCPVMDGLIALQSPYAKEGTYDIIFDWINLATGEVVFRYEPEWRYL